MSFHDRPVPEDDPRVIAALDEYVAALEAGRLPDRIAFLAARADIAGPLDACLDGLDFVQHAAAHFDPPIVDTDLLGATPLGDFRLLRVIGRGGMGTVYEAEQLSLGRRVALKVLPFAAALDPKQLQRFKHEAHAAAHLQHPHIVPVHAVGCERGVHYYAMQLIEGRSLADVIRELRVSIADPVGPEVDRIESAADTRPQATLSTNPCRPDGEAFQRAARLGRQAAEALEYAHQVGVVHRDVKPANLLVDTHDHLWVTDFGLAQLQGQTGLTLTGDMLGTLRYMSPEQAARGPAGIDHRTDVYSLGATLYELLTLRPAVIGSDQPVLVRQILDADPIPPRRLLPAVPRDLETIVLKALAKDPADRYSTARDLAEDLQRFLDDRPVTATRPGVWRRVRKWTRRHRAVVATAGLAGVLLLLTSVFVLSVSMARVTQEQARKDEALEQAKAHLESADRQRARAERNSARAFAVNEVLTRVALGDFSRTTDPDQTRRDLLEEALRSYREFVQEGDTDPSARYETARAYALMARIHAALGRSQVAEQKAGLAQTGFESLVRDFPSEGRHRAELAHLHQWLGGYFRTRLERPRVAEAHCREAIRHFQHLALEDPVAFRLRLASSYYELAYLLTRDPTGREKAEEVYRQTLDILEPEHAAGRVPSLTLAAVYNSLGLLRRQAGRPVDAAALHRAALALGERPAPASSKSNRGERARAHNHLALALWETEQRVEAIGQAEAGVSILREVVREFPTASDSLAELALSSRSLAEMREIVRGPAAAEEIDREALQTAEKLVNNFPGLDADRALMDILTSLVRRRSRDDRPAAERYFQRLRAFHPQGSRAQNDLAWYLVTAKDPHFRDARRAVTLADQAVTGSLHDGTYWNTLGVARFRAGDWSGAVAALDESRRLLNNRHDSFNTFFLAMAHWQLGDREAAHRWYEQAVAWMNRHQPKDAELLQFRKEAEYLLGHR